MGRKSHDLIWRSFIKIGRGAECKHCKRKYAVANVTKLGTHLLSNCLQCPDDIIKGLRKSRSEKSSTQENFDIEEASSSSESMVSLNATSTSNMSSISNTPSTSSTSSTSSTPKPTRIRGFFDNIRAEENFELQQRMAKAVFITGAPLGLFEHPLWVDFFNTIRPSFTLPSRKVISTSLLDKEHTKMENEVHEKLKDAATHSSPVRWLE